MANNKSPVSEQLCRISLDGLAANPSDQVSGAGNDGKAPLCDEYGRLIVVSAGSAPPASQDYYAHKVYISPAAPSNTRQIGYLASVDLLEFSGTYLSGGNKFLQLHRIIGGGPPAANRPSDFTIRVGNNTDFSITYPSNIPLFSEPYLTSTQTLWIVVSSNATLYVAAAGLFYCQALFGEFP